ncbi:type II toxin-antitoxin system PemK/MazF family toxin [Dermatophilaceae bacterium Soc4.6]
MTVAPLTTTFRGLSTEVAVGRHNGLDHDSVVSCDNVTTVSVSDLGRQVGFLPDRQERALADAIRAAFDLE